MLIGEIHDLSYDVHYKHQANTTNITVDTIIVHNVTMDENTVVGVVGVPKWENQVKLKIDGFNFSMGAKGLLNTTIAKIH